MSAFGRSPSTAPPARRRAWLVRAVSAGVAAVVVAGAAAMAVSSPAAAATVDTSAWYVLVNRNSGKAVDVYNLATTDGARITQWTRNNGNQQQWQFVDSGGGYYRIKSRLSGKVLDVSGRST
ncbi:RICIN domain-containing protein, partial [Micromonospora lupini]|uniref:RICIN domain-containing protein n=1 Tax=Micromonospora lupini TaxID=285679 RepID=UPI0033F6B52E